MHVGGPHGDTPHGMIAVDFDGTLLRSDRTVSDRTNRALVGAAEAGWLVVGATGRPLPLAELVARSVPSMGFVACMNGAAILDIETDDVVLDTVVDVDAVLEAGRLIRSRIPSAGLAVDLTDGSQMWEDGFGHLVPLRPLGECDDDVLVALAASGHTDVRKLIAFSDEIEAHALLDAIDELLGPEHGVAHSGLPFVEIGAPGVSKASALAWLADDRGVEVGNCVAFGDEINDHEMLVWAGTGVAMGNADDATKARADVVTAANDDDGIAIYVEELLR
ncbi:MAG: HAD hydrolase family protein [Actinomycetia bacterium]|nr:HAD hydrolase family protein [Actinomycetes bacterium]MCP4958350.1 HAD hydrolase family protein [Actinomycetes bacterium]